MLDRGEIREGAHADLVLFDADTVIDRATFESPHAYPRGIEHVVVNGVLTVESGEHTAARAGRGVRRAPPR